MIELTTLSGRWLILFEGNAMGANKIKYEKLLRRKHTLERHLEVVKEKAEKIKREIKKIRECNGSKKKSRA